MVFKNCFQKIFCQCLSLELPIFFQNFCPVVLTSVVLVPEISPFGLFVTRRRTTTEEELGFLVVVFKVKLYSGASSAHGKRGLDAKPRFANATFGIVNFVACCQTLNQRPLIQYRYRSGGITTFYGTAL